MFNEKKGMCLGAIVKHFELFRKKGEDYERRNRYTQKINTHY